MCYDPERHHRRSIRLKEYDYTQPGAYFVTICTQNRLFLFGDVVEGRMLLNDAGLMVQTVWEGLPRRFPNVQLDAYVVMPNHFHAIVIIVDVHPPVGAPLVGAQKGAGTRPAPTLGYIVGAFKSMTTNEYIRGVRQFRWTPFPGRLWQRNYYEHIIRNEGELNRIRGYIVNNPPRWHLDRENLERVGEDEFDRWLDNLGGKT